MPEPGDIREILRDPSAVAVYIAMELLRGGRDPFEASISKIRALTSLSDPTISKKRAALVEMRVFSESRSGVGLSEQYILLKWFAKFFYKKEGTRKEPKKLLRKEGSSLSSSSVEEPSKRFKKFTKTTPEARREVVRKALRILGAPFGRRLVAQAMKELYGLVEHDGFAVDEALAVVRFCRDEFDRTRFRPLLSLPYIWSSRQFTSLLTASRTGPWAEPDEYQERG